MEHRKYLKVLLPEIFLLVFIFTLTALPGGFLFAETLPDISHDDTLPDGLVSYWPLDEEGGTREDVKDGNDLIDNNLVSSALGIYGNSASFVPENNTYLSLSDSAQIGLEPENISLAVWMRSEIDSADYLDEIMIAKGSSPLGDYRLSLENGGALFFYVKNIPVASSYTIYADAVVTPYIDNLDDGIWHYITATYDGNVSRIYVDGVISAYRTIGAITTDNTVSLTVGKLINGESDEASDHGYFNGTLDEIGFWNRALTADEVARLYNDGKGLPYEVSVEQPVSGCDELTVTECFAKLKTEIKNTNLPKIKKNWLLMRVTLAEKLFEKKGRGCEKATVAILETVSRTLERWTPQFIDDGGANKLSELVSEIRTRIETEGCGKERCS